MIPQKGDGLPLDVFQQMLVIHLTGMFVFLHGACCIGLA